MTIASRFALVVCLIAAGSAQAERDIRVTVTGQVESNGFASGTFAGLGAGTPVVMTIDLDSTDFLDSPHLPGRTRGYRFGPTNFSLRVGNVVTTLRSNPQSAAYFVLRNDDPRVDGFFLSQGTDIDTQIPLAMTPNNFGIAFSRTFGNVPPVGPDPTLGSLRLYDAIGRWELENISSYNFTIELNENVTPLLFAYETITIEPLCGDIDVNNNGVFPEDADVIAFFDVLAGGECAGCDDIDFNNNGVYPEDLDVIDFFNVLAGGDCAN